MPKFYFNIVTTIEMIEDHEGTELADLAKARTEALMDARSLMSAAILKGNDISGQHIAICDEDRKVLLRVPFSEAYGREF